MDGRTGRQGARTESVRPRAKLKPAGRPTTEQAPIAPSPRRSTEARVRRMRKKESWARGSRVRQGSNRSGQRVRNVNQERPETPIRFPDPATPGPLGRDSRKKVEALGKQKNWVL